MISEAMQRASREAAVCATVMLKNCSTRLKPPAKKAIPKTSSRLDSMLPMSDVLTMVISSLIKAWTDTMSSTALLNQVRCDQSFERMRITYPKDAFSNPPSVSPTRRANSSVALLSMAASGMMAMKLMRKTPMSFTL